MNLSEALLIFEDQLPDIRKACVLNIRHIISTYPDAKELTDDTDFTKEAIHQHVNYLLVKNKTANYLKTIKRIDGQNKHYSNQSITNDDIARAKDKPLEELFEGQLFGRKRKYGLCPFHDEKTPSFYIFPDNRFKCFGCSVHGTAVDYIMLRDNKTFIEAVKILCNL